MERSRLTRFEKLIAKGAVDAKVRAKIAESPREACTDAGIESPTQAELDKLAALVKDLERISETLGVTQDDIEIWSMGLAQFKNFTTLD